MKSRLLVLALGAGMWGVKIEDLDEVEPARGRSAPNNLRPHSRFDAMPFGHVLEPRQPVGLSQSGKDYPAPWLSRVTNSTNLHDHLTRPKNPGTVLNSLLKEPSHANPKGLDDPLRTHTNNLAILPARRKIPGVGLGLPAPARAPLPPSSTGGSGGHTSPKASAAPTTPALDLWVAACYTGIGLLVLEALGYWLMYYRLDESMPN